ncbi:SanA/YdcF family protein [Otariodibacter oris]|nr:ElyC/SanA/YdcF family protein [Otariodibacter oris]
MPKLIKLIISGGISFFCLMLLIDMSIGYLVKDRIYTNIEDLPYREYALVLGTAKYYPSGSPNLYYKYRLDATQQVYDNDKVSYFLMSGDNSTAYYNEPKVMTSDLQKLGVPNTLIKQDYAGYNTLDSIVRADKVFDLSPFTIISQRFHCERALFIAKFYDIDAICFVAQYPEEHYKVRIREFFARTAMLINLIIGVQPTTLEESKITEL